MIFLSPARFIVGNELVLSIKVSLFFPRLILSSIPKSHVLPRQRMAAIIILYWKIIIQAQTFHVNASPCQ